MRPGALAVSFAALVAASPAAALDPRTLPGQYVQRSWGTAHGLPQGSVVALAQTPDRYIWVGTRAGLARFDGVSFKSVPAVSPVPLSERAVAALASDPNGSLWIGLGGMGILRWHADRLVHYRTTDGVPTSLKTVRVTKDGGVWAGGWNSGLLKFDGARWPVVDVGEVLPPASSVHALGADEAGNLWVGTSRGLVRVREGRAVMVPLEPPGGEISAVIQDREGHIWAGGNRGLYRVEGSIARRVLSAAPDGLGVVEVLLSDRHRNLWIGTRRGLFRWDGVRLARCDASPALTYGYVGALLEDVEGSLWVGLEGGGLHQLKEGGLLRFLDSGGAPAPPTTVLEARDGALWVGTEVAGLWRLHDGKIERIVNADGVPHGLWSLAEDDSGALWAGASYHGQLFRYSQGRIMRMPYDERLATGVRALVPDGTGGAWIGLALEGLYRVRGTDVTRVPLGRPPSQSEVFSLFRDRRGRLWVGHKDGVAWLERGERTGEYRHPEGAYTTSFHEDAAGDLWITTGVGLLRHREGRFTHYVGRDGLYAEALMTMQEDDLGRLWICSRKGIFRVRKSDFDDLDRGLARRVTSVRYATSEGSNPLECLGGHAPSSWRTRDGRLWFATRAGVISIDPSPAANRGLSSTAPVLVESVAVDGEAPRLPRAMTLSPGSHRVQIQYTTPTFLAPEAVSFRYRLEGYDGDWVLVGGNRQAEYTNLSPGDYRFRVAALDEDGTWREARVPLLIRIRPHLWQTRPFFAGSALTVVAAALVLSRLRARRLEARFRVVTAERNRISRELHDNLGARLAGLRLQLDAAARRLPDDPGGARRELDEARAELPQSLAETRRAIWMLRAEALARGGLAGALEECARLTTAGTGARAEVCTEGALVALPWPVEEHLLRIAQEALANAVRHGQAHRISVRLVVRRRVVTLEIDDDGRGIEQQVPGADAGHFGLASMRERVSLLRGQFVIGRGASGGTRITVTVSLGWLFALRSAWRSRRSHPRVSAR